MLEPQGIATVACNVLEHEFDRQSASQVLGAARPTTMFLEAPPDIERDARVETAIGAAQDIDAVRQRRYASRWTRSVDAGYFSSDAAERIGRDSKLPPQLGQTPANTLSTQSRQNVHSNVQIMASGDSGGRSRSQASQFGRSASMDQALPPVRASPRTRNAPTSIPDRFSGVSENVSAISSAPSSASIGPLNFSRSMLPIK